MLYSSCFFSDSFSAIIIITIIASFPHQLKEAMIKPLIKKSNLDTDEFKNFRPISNPRFLSKIVEKVVAVQLIEYLEVIPVSVQEVSQHGDCSSPCS